MFCGRERAFALGRQNATNTPQLRKGGRCYEHGQEDRMSGGNHPGVRC